MHKTIISTAELAAHLSDPDWIVLDCRFDLARPEWGLENYSQGHISGSGYAHLDKDLSSHITEKSGRHPLPNVEELAARFSNWGIGASSQVVVYDTTGGAYAGRLWWLLHFLGHSAAAVLDGGFQKWQREGRPVSLGVEVHAPSVFIPRPNWEMVVDAAAVEQIRSDPAFKLVDARAPERYRGETEPIDPVAGHIPGAVNRFHGLNLSQDGTFLSPEILRAQFSELLGDTLPENVIVYCGSGVTSIHHILAMELAGFSGARLYAGSWSEWIRDRKRPIS